MKEVLDELKKASNKSPEDLLNLIYAKHPPKRGQKQSDSCEMKKKLKKALLHYHPDKQDVDADGLKWIVLSEEITVALTHHFERLKEEEKTAAD